MKFPRNARIFRGQLDAAPFVTVLFLLVMFLMLGSRIYTPGVALELPVADDLPGTDKPTVSVAIDANGRLYFEDQVIDEAHLVKRLREAKDASTEPLALVVQADKAVSYDKLMHLTQIAREAQILQVWLATLPRPLASRP